MQVGSSETGSIGAGESMIPIDFSKTGTSIFVCDTCKAETTIINAVLDEEYVHLCSHCGYTPMHRKGD